MGRRRRTLRFRLPELSAREAAALSYFLDQLDNALWLEHGADIRALCEHEGIPLIATDNDRAQISDKERER